MRAARAARSALRRAAPATLIARRSLFVELERDVVRPAALAAYKARVAAHGARAPSTKATGRPSAWPWAARAASTTSAPSPTTAALATARRPARRSAASADVVFAEATATLAGAGLRASPAARSSTRRRARSRTPHLRARPGLRDGARFLELYAAGLADKLAVDDTGESTLVSLLHSEAGVAPLNTVIELWRHDSAQGSMRSRVKSREATTWRAAIGDIAAISTRFETQLLAPLYA
ncbi:3'-tRNA processing endoribonuclease [Aureococcus anophagefferens]|nr:3'-tRNA processing endoribonuclease [Aureococcus anophagefferens]